MIRRIGRGAAWVVCLAAVGCGGTPAEVPAATIPVAERIGDRVVRKIDLLLVIDNSRSMADKQLILAASIPDLVSGISNPPCVDGAGMVTPEQPAGPDDACAAGTRRRAMPIRDIHIGVITSSLGGHASDACPAMDTTSCPGGAVNTSASDAAHLLTRRDPCSGGTVPTYLDQRFLAWDPDQKLFPPGEKDLGAVHVNPATGAVDTVSPGLAPSLRDLVVGAGQVGCGYPSQLESWYRFLADPEPYQSLQIELETVSPLGTDELVLKQRADFLRPSSLLGIVLLTDENDCSLKDSGSAFFALQQYSTGDPTQPYHPWRASKECAQNPDDPCCAWCSESPAECPVDDECTKGLQLSAAEDPIDLRCWDQKRRFGMDLLQPIDRYTAAFSSIMLPARDGTILPNPIFSDLDPKDEDSVIRDPSLVVFAGIVGVPWQDLARDPQDLRKGLKRQVEYSITDAQGHTTWDRIVGDSKHHLAPADLHMVESVAPRAGLPPPGSAPDADPVHGHEYTPPGGDDLQYACAFPLPAPRDCAAAPGGCDCQSSKSDSPLCDPATPTLQVRAKAYPGLRELELLRALGDRGVVASVCPAQVDDPSRLDYGYRPAMELINDRLAAVEGRGCLPSPLPLAGGGLVSCVVLEMQTTEDPCSCDPAHGRRKPRSPVLITSAQQSLSADPSWNCFCEVVQAGDPLGSTPEALAACEGDPSLAPKIADGPLAGKPADGWCYLDPAQNPASNPDIVVGCQTGSARILRFLGSAKPPAKATQLLMCGTFVPG
ncbi:MAG: hypothetical protein ABJE95_07645 [Byssovorax sp.]